MSYDVYYSTGKVEVWFMVVVMFGLIIGYKRSQPKLNHPSKLLIHIFEDLKESR